MHPDTEKLAAALGWVCADRNGVEVWYDPTGGHVLPCELPAALDAAVDELIATAPTPLPEDLAALEKLGSPFRPKP